MLKKSVLLGFSALVLASNLSAVNLAQFNSDFYALVQGIGRDVAPSLRMGALAGDLQGEASIEHFTVTPLAFGVNATDGLGTILQPGAYGWQYALHMDNLVNSNVSNTSFERLMLYPSFKSAFGMALGDWDITVSGMYFPQALTQATTGSTAANKLQPQFSFGNLGLEVRRKILSDSGAFGWVPGLSLGAGYHLSFFSLATTIKSLSDVGIGAQTVGTNQTMDMSGTMNFSTFSQVATVDLHVSKHIAFVTPYTKLSGAYQNSTFTGTTNLVATVTDSSNSANNSTQNINANPVVNVSDFAFILNPGVEFDVLAVIFNLNALIDLGDANISFQNGFTASGLALNAGLRFAF